MNPTIVGIIVSACTFGGALFGMWVSTVLKEHHVEAASKDTVKVAIGLISAMTALILGLVTSSAKSSFDADDTLVKQTATQILTLDRVLARFGPETKGIRVALKQLVGTRIDVLSGRASPTASDPLLSVDVFAAEKFVDAIRELKPQDDNQRALRSRAIDLSETILQTRWMALTTSENTVPLPFLVVITFWLTVVFVSFGVFSKPNMLVVPALFFCALSVGAALFLVLELSSPFSGLLRVSPEPLRHVYQYLGQ